MRARVTLQRPTRVADEIGGAATSWLDEGVVWVSLQSAAFGERADFDTLSATGAFRLTINRREDVRVGWRVLWGERVLRVSGVGDDGGARMALTCLEERP